MINLLKNIAIKTRYFSIVLLLLSFIFSIFSAGLMYAELFGGGIGLAAGYVVMLTYIIYGLSFIAYINRLLLIRDKEFPRIIKIYDLIILNGVTFFITWKFFLISVPIFINTDIYIGIDIFSIFHIFIFSLLSFLDFKKNKILERKICKIIVNIINILFFIFSAIALFTFIVFLIISLYRSIFLNI